MKLSVVAGTKPMVCDNCKAIFHAGWVHNAYRGWACSEACAEALMEAAWRDNLRARRLDYYPDPSRYDKLGRKLGE